MAVNKGVKSISLAAGADYSTSQFRIVTIATDGQIDPVAAGTVPAIGVLMNKPAAAGAGAEVAIAGVAKVEAGAAIDEGSWVVAVTGGRGSPVAAGGTAYVVGMCVQSASGSGAFAGVLVMPQKIVAA